MPVDKASDLEKSLTAMAERYSKVQKSLQANRSAASQQESEPTARQVRIERAPASPVTQGKR